MRIANPIYDVVFKYLLDDEKVARLVLSALLGKEVLELRFRPTEVRHEGPNPDGSQLLVLRLDFAATVRLEDGSLKLVLIEIQKARTAWDVQRFRRYLGNTYASKENVFLGPDGEQQALPIVTIYFLGEGLDCVDVPVLKVNRQYLDVATGEDVKITDPFVEALTHDAIVVQINRLKNRRRTDLERLLEVFDQGLVSGSDPHLLDILEENFPEHHREVLRRLLRAGAEKELLDKMDVEDDVFETLRKDARNSADLRQTLAEKDQALAEKDRTLARMEKSLAEKDQALAKMVKTLAKMERTLAKMEKSLAEKDRTLIGMSVSLAEMKQMLAGTNQALAERDLLIADLQRRLTRT